MSDRHPTTQRGRIRIVGFDDAVADQQAGDRENDDDDDTIATGPIDSSTTPGETTTETESEPDRPRRRLEDAWRRFRRNRTAMAGLGVIVVMAVLAVFARPIEVSTAEVTITLQPFSLAPYDPSAMFVGPANAPPSRAHPFGTDWAGRDQLSRVLVGGRYTLGIGLVAVALALCVGVPSGRSQATSAAGSTRRSCDSSTCCTPSRFWCWRSRSSRSSSRYRSSAAASGRWCWRWPSPAGSATRGCCAARSSRFENASTSRPRERSASPTGRSSADTSSRTPSPPSSSRRRSTSARSSSPRRRLASSDSASSPGAPSGVRCSPRAGVRSYRAAGTSPSSRARDLPVRAGDQPRR